MSEEQFLLAKMMAEERGFIVERSDINHKLIEISRIGKYCGAFYYESFLNFLKGWDLHRELNS